MSDWLALAHAIEDAGIEHGRAQRLASVIFDAILDNVATKADIATLTTKVEAVAADVRAVVRTEVQGMRTDLKDDLVLIERRLLTRLGGLMVVVTGVILAAVRYWLPGHG